MTAALPKALPPVELLLDRFSYDPATGIFTWRVDRHSGRNGARVWRAGTEAGRINRRGYRQISVDGVWYSAHRAAWLIFYREEPPDEIDHKDRNKANNAIDNLRAATRSQNGVNSALARNNTSGFTGVEPHWRKWRASIRVNGKTRHLGLFATRDAAIAARIKATARLFGEFSPHPTPSKEAA
jgi:hypothetical protein